MLAAYLRGQRQERGFSVERLARLAGIAPSTIRRWESGATLPRLSELRAVLDALGIAAGQQAEALALLNTRQGARVRRALRTLESAESAPVSVAAPPDVYAGVPGAGDLWRAMRQRQGLTGKELALNVGVRPYRVTRWEKSDDVPPDDLLPRLFDALKAYPEERTFLSQRSRLLPPLESEARGHRHGLAIYEARLDVLERLVAAGVEMPGDLTFLALEAELTPLARAGRRDALLLLARTTAAHAEWLEKESRTERLARYADAVLGMMRPLGRTVGNVPHNERWWVRATILRSDCLVRQPLKHLPPERATPLRYGRAIDFLKEQLPLFTHRWHALRLYQVIAANLTMVGGLSAGQAVPLATLALRAAEREADGWTGAEWIPLQVLLNCRVTLTRLLFLDGRAAEALRQIEEQERLLSLAATIALDAGLAAWLTVRKAEVLTALEAGTEAWESLSAFYGIVDGHRLGHLRWLGDEVASRLRENGR